MLFARQKKKQRNQLKHQHELKFVSSNYQANNTSWASTADRPHQEIGSEKWLFNCTFTYFPSSATKDGVWMQRFIEVNNWNYLLWEKMKRWTRNHHRPNKRFKKRWCSKLDPLWIVALLSDQYRWYFKQIQWPHKDSVPVGGGLLNWDTSIKGYWRRTPFLAILDGSSLLNSSEINPTATAGYRGKDSKSRLQKKTQLFYDS